MTRRAGPVRGQPPPSCRQEPAASQEPPLGSGLRRGDEAEEAGRPRPRPPAGGRGLGSLAFGSLVMAALVLALAFRVAGLDVRPMHHDEANQALKFGALLETGEYRYDRNDHHGPTLYYLTLPSAWIRGQRTLSSLDERTLRVVPAIFGAGLILLLLPLARDLGRPAVGAAALLAAASPALTYYSRFYIQESLFAFFAIGFLVALGRSVQDRSASWAVTAGAFAGLAYATKETSVIVLLAAVAAAVVAGSRPGASATSPPGPGVGRGVPGLPARSGAEGSGIEGSPAKAGRGAVYIVAGAAVALLVAFVLFSSFFRYPTGLLESFRAFGIYAARGVEAGPHAHPWYYYFSLLMYSSSGGLVWTEGLVLGLALVGLIAAWLTSRSSHTVETATAPQASPGFWARYLALYCVIAAAGFSAVRYKTPWNALPFHAGFVVMAGFGAAWLIEVVRPRVARAALVLALAAAICHLGLENWRANFRYAADPRNPYVYAQTSPDFLRLVRRVMELTALQSEPADMLVKVVAGPYEQWPLPWYLRRMRRVGYWPRASDAGTLDDAPVIVAAQENVAALDAVLGDRYVSEFYGLRPDVLLTVYIERSLWDRFLAGRGQSQGLTVLPSQTVNPGD